MSTTYGSDVDVSEDLAQNEEFYKGNFKSDTGYGALTSGIADTFIYPCFGFMSIILF